MYIYTPLCHNIKQPRICVRFDVLLYSTVLLILNYAQTKAIAERNDVEEEESDASMRAARAGRIRTSLPPSLPFRITVSRYVFPFRFFSLNCSRPPTRPTDRPIEKSPFPPIQYSICAHVCGIVLTMGLGGPAWAVQLVALS